MYIGLPTKVFDTYKHKFVDYVSINKIKVTRLLPKVKYTGKTKGFLKLYVYSFDDDFEKLLIDVLYLGHNPIVVKTKKYNDIIVFEYAKKIYSNNMSNYITRKSKGEIFYSIS